MDCAGKWCCPPLFTAEAEEEEEAEADADPEAAEEEEEAEAAVASEAVFCCASPFFWLLRRTLALAAVG